MILKYQRNVTFIDMWKTYLSHAFIGLSDLNFVQRQTTRDKQNINEKLKNNYQSITLL